VLELVAVLGVMLALLVVAAGGGFAHAELLLGVGAGIALLGLVVGAAAGVVYHVALYRSLSPLDVLRPGWWWRPTSLHVHLPPGLRRGVMPWFYAGAAGFFVALAGCAVVLAAILTM
jgi:hypothetical protein